MVVAETGNAGMCGTLDDAVLDRAVCCGVLTLCELWQWGSATRDGVCRVMWPVGSAGGELESASAASGATARDA